MIGKPKYAIALAVSCCLALAVPGVASLGAPIEFGSLSSEP